MQNEPADPWLKNLDLAAARCFVLEGLLLLLCPLAHLSPFPFFIRTLFFPIVFYLEGSEKTIDQFAML